MAWKELLQQHQTQENGEAQETDASQAQGSLLQQVRLLVGQTAPDVPAAEASTEAHGKKRAACADGYVRRSPAQPYVTPPDYRRRRIRKAVLFLIVLAFLILLAVALLRSKWIRIQ